MATAPRQSLRSAGGLGRGGCTAPDPARSSDNLGRAGAGIRKRGRRRMKAGPGRPLGPHPPPVPADLRDAGLVEPTQGARGTLEPHPVGSPGDWPLLRPQLEARYAEVVRKPNKETDE
jgi:hypothetical protein